MKKKETSLLLAKVLVIILVILTFLFILLLVIKKHIWPAYDFDFNKLLSIGTFIGGVISPFLTIATIIILVANFQHTQKEYYKKVEDLELDRNLELKKQRFNTEVSQMKLEIDELSEYFNNFTYFFLNQLGRFYTFKMVINKTLDFNDWLKNGKKEVKYNHVKMELFLKTNYTESQTLEEFNKMQDDLNNICFPHGEMIESKTRHFEMNINIDSFKSKLIKFNDLGNKYKEEMLAEIRNKKFILKQKVDHI